MTSPTAATTTTDARDTASVLLAMYTETPLHAGTGQSTGTVDLPIQRERHTGFPLIPATSLKGSLRERAERGWQDHEAAVVDALFGPLAKGSAELHAGALALTDARLLAFPMRSLSDVFVWVTCPLALGRLQRDLRLVGMAARLAGDGPPPGQAVAGSRQFGGRPLVLEDLSYTVSIDHRWAAVATELAGLLPAGDAHRVYRDRFRDHLVLLSDDDFAYCVQHATEVSARIKLNERKTTSGDGGNLWYEETLPADCLLYTLLRAEQPRTRNGPLSSSRDVRARLLSLLEGEPGFLQVGGNETVGHGWCALRVVEQWPPANGEADAQARQRA